MNYKDIHLLLMMLLKYYDYFTANKSKLTEKFGEQLIIYISIISDCNNNIKYNYQFKLYSI